ncbi:MAG: response regulator transcription factor [Deferribacteraceae bacterium]|jgi:two-component system phosphate regulon response regulator PhoB|nr:response regulator transcription factor [Deferribacteraceae bacterium]
MNILIADDELRLRKVVAMFLKKSGHDVTEVADGSQALSALRLKAFDVVVLDLMMPILNGLDTCIAIKSNPEYKDIPILLLTASVSSEERAKGIAAGASAYVTKPFSPKDLLERITELTSKLV